MQNHAAVFRTKELLHEGIEKLNTVADEMSNVKVSF